MTLMNFFLGGRGGIHDAGFPMPISWADSMFQILAIA